jgi:glycosyltransferase involved in cell wall biosynthesis
MKISVIVPTYNHGKYITQCLESILCQKGDFQMEVIIGDDCSTDDTRLTATQFQSKYPGIFFLLPPKTNIGVTKNLKRCLDACSGEYIAVCEGDDYWTDERKLQKQLSFLQLHPDHSMCFSAILIYYEDSNHFETFADPYSLTRDFLTTADLITNNYIGNFSCCIYRTDVVRRLPTGIFDFFTVDWMFNMVCGELGKIGFLREQMSVYRKHKKGVWAGSTELENLHRILPLIDTYNRFFDYKYDSLFRGRRKLIEREIARLTV